MLALRSLSPLMWSSMPPIGWPHLGKAFLTQFRNPLTDMPSLSLRYVYVCVTLEPLVLWVCFCCNLQCFSLQALGFSLERSC